MLYRKRNMTIIQKVNDHYIVTKAEYVGVSVPEQVATFDKVTETATFFGQKIRTKDIDKSFKAVRLHYQKILKF